MSHKDMEAGGARLVHGVSLGTAEGSTAGWWSIPPELDQSELTRAAKLLEGSREVRFEARVTGLRRGFACAQEGRDVVHIPSHLDPRRRLKVGWVVSGSKDIGAQGEWLAGEWACDRCPRAACLRLWRLPAHVAHARQRPPYRSHAPYYACTALGGSPHSCGHCAEVWSATVAAAQIGACWLAPTPT
jgi:hypothetical protein